MSTTTRQPWTAGELCRLPAGWRYEIDEGELVIMAPAGMEHGRVESRTAHVLSTFVYARGMGEVFTGEVGFRLGVDPETLRGADVAFIARERLARIPDRKGFASLPPDLAVEIHDASEPDLRRKIEQYLAAGVRSVWVVDPDARTLTQHRSGAQPDVTAEPGATVSEPVLPGFACRLRDLFGEG